MAVLNRVVVSILKRQPLVTSIPRRFNSISSSSTTASTSNTPNITENSPNAAFENEIIEKDDMFVINQKQENDKIRRYINRLKMTPSEEIEKQLEGMPDSITKNNPELDTKLKTELLKFFDDFSNKNDLFRTMDEYELLTNDDSTTRAQSIDNMYSQSSVGVNDTLNNFPFLEPSQYDKPYTKQELFLRQLKHSRSTARLGATIKNVYNPRMNLTNPINIQNLTIKDLFNANVHLGQSKSIINPSNKRFIMGTYMGLNIIDLNKTLISLKRAHTILSKINLKNGIILFIGTRNDHKEILKNVSNRLKNAYIVTNRWIPGTLTNPTEISNNWERIVITENGGNLTQKIITDSEIIKPDLIVVLNPNENKIALREAMKCRIPSIGIIDTDCESSLVTYPIPGNDDSFRSLSMLVGVLTSGLQ
ncbi:hypothetical protein TBLA_0I00250 [Henningerozyma blattae CBS 6284]|uniref:Ribosomal protein S2 n=1 Tax=Henningerozyma blattae (strain ATCC 34711 / CBS 6284 / DSM 70876 / NBRC 10599 / NRRL Y-10934 / UCD 77-7) TaxID=1071380 RepID=I2H8I8_HENB6|nr:hypothetical protein TBLA_0I00250 [Tetrapisispora blattae CBS 6284]CCH62690.1 hypothetical protein TBLA_0I00250 [Tetrapisispora blattae CBS 6284]